MEKKRDHVVNINDYNLIRAKEKYIVCQECESTIPCEAVDILEDQKIELPASSDIPVLWVTYFECPICGHKYRITIDTEDTLEIRSKYRKQIKKLKNCRDSERKARIRSMERTKKQLTNMYNVLNKKYDKDFQKLFEEE